MDYPTLRGHWYWHDGKKFGQFYNVYVVRLPDDIFVVVPCDVWRQKSDDSFPKVYKSFKELVSEWNIEYSGFSCYCIKKYDDFLTCAKMQKEEFGW